MKRGLRVRTGVRAPALPPVAGVAFPVGQLQESALPGYVEQYTFLPLIRCAARTKAGEPCGVCWYCKQAEARP